MQKQTVQSESEWETSRWCQVKLDGGLQDDLRNQGYEARKGRGKGHMVKLETEEHRVLGG